MAFEIKTSIEINASPEEVWKILMNKEDYPKWNPFVKSLQGDLKKGACIAVNLQGMKFKPVIQTFIKNKEFSWLGHLGMKGLFDGRHLFKLIETENGNTIFEHGEQFQGFLVPLLKRKLLTETKPGFEAMNQSLKAQAEK